MGKRRISSGPCGETTEFLNILLPGEMLLPLEGETELPLSLDDERDHHHPLGTPFGGVASPGLPESRSGKRWCEYEYWFSGTGAEDAAGDCEDDVGTGEGSLSS